MTTLTMERIFSSGDLPLLSLPQADGLITCRWVDDVGAVDVIPPNAARSADERRGARVGFVMVEPSWLTRAAAERARGPYVDAVVLHIQSGLPGRSALALAFAAHLRASPIRAARGEAVLTAGVRPDLAGLTDLVRVPHLVTVTDATGAIADTVVWEIMRGEQFDSWLDGAPRPDQLAIEAHLPALLRLRGLHRAGRLDRRRAAVLVDLLDGGTLSTWCIHRFPRLVLPLAAAAAVA